ncbi:MAG: HNH endonuclease [Candidatus Nephrothrix sp. EaCA]|nr:MAG: HNH endonuclease [Candidatus Nephrothrix sp. EaCA]
MAVKWRWDQGRLGYFQFENLKAIAHCLQKSEGIFINQKDIDPLRTELENYTGLPFAPKSYRVWRNYKRVFECSFLATAIDNQLYVTDFCKKIAASGEKEIDADEFLSLFIPRFRFPFAAFADYTKSARRIYPFCAVLKYLISNFQLGKQANISLEDIFSVIVGNHCTGLEPIAHYAALKRTRCKPDKDETRQVREMMIFISQLSILKWHKDALFLDVSAKDFEDYNGFEHLTNPLYKEPKKIREEEYLSMTSLAGQTVYPFKLQSREIPADDIFIEGKRTRVTHIKIERSPLLRKLFFEKCPETICDMCMCETTRRYPWVDNLLEVHHILPLSSALSITGEGISLNDVVGLCPNCHKSVHAYYKNWFNKYKVDDFRSRAEAKEIYCQAKTSIVL